MAPLMWLPLFFSFLLLMNLMKKNIFFSTSTVNKKTINKHMFIKNKNWSL
uniref:ATP synthase F0 subunit 8 n=1 Tax=Trinorchestia longiramus TaxID=1923959 RepID=A0A385UKS7_9CRUS|nr:ATP synthase F0 subunit 8 [Trinorchestia longiramus]AYB71592.1 ATP synthase F0 subunit 8 [Trinorchestia longiramus]